jgi:UDP:flavonoid glycosyltransferase YjiC (YdhE family)
VTVLATFVGGWGHAEPLLPVAALARSSGHHVAFAGQAAVLPLLTGLGFATCAVGPDTLVTERLPIVPVDREHERTVVRDHFVARFGAERSCDLRELFVREQPDVVVCDEADVGAVVAAEVLGIPCVTVSVIAAGRLMSPAVVGDVWDQLRARHGLRPDPRCERMGGTLALAPVPRSFRAPEVPWPPTLRPVRPAILDLAARQAAPATGRPFAYATLGTVFNVESGDLLERLVAALGLVDADALVTIGAHISAHELGPVPPNVRIETYVPQHEVLPRCQAVVCHGGSGTLVAALSLGVPVVVLPMGADQPDNADRCLDLGVGAVLDPVVADPAAIAGALRLVVEETRFAEAATRLAQEASAQPALSEVPELVALLARGSPHAAGRGQR